MLCMVVLCMNRTGGREPLDLRRAGSYFVYLGPSFAIFKLMPHLHYVHVLREEFS